MQQKIARGAVLLALALAAATASRAQPMLYYPGTGVELPPYEIMAIVRSTGLDPVSRPVRRGPVYSLRALDRAGREVRVEIDRMRGHILRVAPVAGLRYADVPPPYGRPPGLVPDGYDLDEPRAPAPPAYEDGPPVSDRAPPGEPIVPDRGSAGSRPTAQTAAPPLPRPRPRLAATRSPAAEPASPRPPRGAEQRENGTTGAVATSSSKPPWHGIEQQE